MGGTIAAEGMKNNSWRVEEYQLEGETMAAEALHNSNRTLVEI